MCLLTSALCLVPFKDRERIVDALCQSIRSNICYDVAQMLTVPVLKALAVGLDLKLGGRHSGSRDAILAWYRRTVLPPPGSGTVSSRTWTSYVVLHSKRSYSCIACMCP